MLVTASQVLDSIGTFSESKRVRNPRIDFLSAILRTGRTRLSLRQALDGMHVETSGAEAEAEAEAEAGNPDFLQIMKQVDDKL